ncbi:helix-turn-helix domain-containing protein [Brevibacillus sp. M2.1A]|uniref:helix-turn-helix domain-containing protein n=1 Tax=Brevibacillus sp. M2.1A TaxID=2738980 RepID=UPI00156B0221|nr:helix-turn-helix domain-containing protein [Brevibacillus sp. M2.1A]MCC8438563.1 helix-turn-helix domain-containing protein [Brevibacillus sp. M2.1A]
MRKGEHMDMREKTELKVYPFINQDNQKMVSHSSLYCLKPLGLGTAAMESLTSYITRLAQAHCIKTGDLFSNILFPILNKDYTNHIIVEGGNGFYDWAHSINGITSIAVEFIEMLGNLTGNLELRELTLLRFEHVLPNRGLLKREKFWCPMCYQEMKDNTGDVYDPLLWLIQSVKVCSKHHVFLRNECQHCKRTQLILERRSTPGYCVHCYSWLGSLDFQQDVDEWELAKTKHVEQLISTASNSFVKREGIKSTLTSLVGKYTNFNQAEFARKISVPKSTFWGWYRGKNLPSLDDVIRICNIFGITVIDFYSSKLHFGNHCTIPLRRKIKENHCLTLVPSHKLRMTVRQFVGKKNEPISVVQMANRLNCNKKTLYKYCGKLCKVQSSMNKSYKQKCRNKRRSILNSHVQGAFYQILDEGNIPSVRRIEQVMKRPAILKEKEVRMKYYQLRRNSL